MKRFDLFDLRPQQGATIVALAVAILHGISGPARAANVLIAGDVLTQTASQKAVYRFDSSGTQIDTFGETTLGSYFSIAVHGDTIYVGVTGDGIKRFSLAGDFLGYTPYPQRPGFSGVPRIETDSAGNLYYVDGYGGGGRLNPTGSHSPVFPQMQFTDAIDADAVGNIYVVGRQQGVGDRLFKYDAAGNQLGAVQRPDFASDIAIDEAADILYLAVENDNAFGIRSYDISGPLPVSIGAIPTPGAIVGLSFDPASGHLFGTNLFAGRGWELTTDGTVIQRFNMGVDAFALAAFDIVAIPAPEPATGFLAMCVAGLAFAVGRSRR